LSWCELASRTGVNFRARLEQWAEGGDKRVSQPWSFLLEIDEVVRSSGRGYISAAFT
jgi:hypothetical protein